MRSSERLNGPKRASIEVLIQSRNIFPPAISAKLPKGKYGAIYNFYHPYWHGDNFYLSENPPKFSSIMLPFVRF